MFVTLDEKVTVRGLGGGGTKLMGVFSRVLTEAFLTEASVLTEAFNGGFR